MSVTVAEYSRNKDVVIKGLQMVLCSVRPDNSITDVLQTCSEILGHYFRKPFGHYFIISHQIGTFAKLRKAVTITYVNIFVFSKMRSYLVF